MLFCKIKSPLLVAIIPTTLMMVSAVSAAIPDAGSLSVELNKERQQLPSTGEAVVDVEINTTQVELSSTKVQINEVLITGQDIFPPETLQAIIAEDLKKEVSLKDLQNMAKKITMFLQKEGYMTALTYLPAQEIVDGKVRMEVLIGKYEDMVFDNKSDLLTGRARGLAWASQTERLIMRNKMDRLLLIMNDIPGVKAHAVLSPGKKNGTAIVEYKLSRTEKSGGYIFADNFGSRYTGRNRFGATYYVNNLTNVGDQLQLTYMTSNKKLNNYDIKYELPVGNFGTFVGVSYSNMDYELGEHYSNLDAHGVAQTLKIFSTTPLKRSLNNNLFFKFSYENRVLSDSMELFNYTTKKSSDVIRTGLDGDYRNQYFASRYKIIHSIGRMGMDNLEAKEADLYKTAGLFQKTEIDLYHVQKMSKNINLHFSLAGQYAWDGLDSSEKFYIGGYNAVRAFPQGESGGDMGILSTAELRWQMPADDLQLAGFIDTGWVSYNKNPIFKTNNSRVLTGAGVGLIWSKSNNIFARLDYAFPLSNSYSQTDGKEVHGRWWIQAVKKI